MMAQLLPPQPNSERISQLLPTVTCSSCSNPVPISELTDHVCSPMSSAPKTPPPLRHRQTPLGRPTQILPAGPGRIPTPSNATNARTPTPPAILRAQRPPLKPLHVQAPARSSSRAAAPLVSPGTKVPPKTSEAPSFRHLPPILSSNRSHSTSPRPLITRSNTPSNPNSSASSHHVLPPFASNVRSQNIIHRPDHSMPHSPNMGPYYPEENIDTSSGGEAGMAGVGRRGFAAVARAAMFSANYQRRAEVAKVP
ncbi:hypothetical protein F5887DRAFT_301435 [Amanita rubescens]|nr:hypothetical protein F5887DRAFT_301435 [Amanita rubescens]